MKAVVASAKHGSAILVQDRPLPKLRDGWVLVKCMAAAINPADHMYLEYGLAEAGCLLGCDYAGVILEVGSGCVRDWKKGDRICGCTRGGDATEPENGTFADVIVVKADIGLRIPDGMTFEDAAATGVTVLTTGRCLYQKLDITMPSSADILAGQDQQILIYGGSTAMGTMLIQFATLSGFQVMTTCSSQNFNLVRSYGAIHIYDYNSSSAVQEIRSITGGKLRYVVDCISTPPSADFCAATLSPGGVYSSIGLSRSPREDVTTHQTLGYSFLGEPWEFLAGQKFPASREDFDYSVTFAKLSESLLAEGKIRPHPIEVKNGGLEAVPGGIEDLRAKKISGRKLVVKMN